MTIAINVEELRERPHLFVPHLDGVEAVETVEVLQAHYERAVLKLTNSAGLTRFLKLDTNESRHRHEVVGLEFLATRTMAPEVIFADPHRDGLAALVVAEATGKPLSAHSSQADWAAVARLMADTNSVEANVDQTPSDDDWLQYLAGLANYADGSDLVAHAVGGTTQSIVDEVVNYQLGPGQLGFIHGDAQPGHFFVTDGRIQAIDLADWTVGDVAFDLAVLTLDNANRLDDLLVAFDGADRISITARVDLYSMLRLATEIRWFDEHDFDPTQLLDRLGSMASDRRQPR